MGGMQSGADYYATDERSRFAWELLQHTASFKTVPARLRATSTDHPFPTLSMDLTSLEQEIERDKASSRNFHHLQWNCCH